MKVIHVLRKPCSEGTVVANVLKHGTGVSGMWPANLVLQHLGASRFFKQFGGDKGHGDPSDG